jgi:hypothetical protein
MDSLRVLHLSVQIGAAQCVSQILFSSIHLPQMVKRFTMDMVPILFKFLIWTVSEEATASDTDSGSDKIKSSIGPSVSHVKSFCSNVFSFAMEKIISTATSTLVHPPSSPTVHMPMATVTAAALHRAGITTRSHMIRA